MSDSTVLSDAPGFTRNGLNDVSVQPLSPLLEDLEARLGEFREGTARPADGEQNVHQWQDEGFVYLETVLPVASDLDVDISFHGGRVFIRIVR